MFDLSYRPTDDGLVPRLEFDVILAVDCAHQYTGWCYYPEWSLLPRTDISGDAVENLIGALGYYGEAGNELDDFDFDSIYGSEVKPPAAFEEFFDNFGVWKDGDPDYEEPRELVGVYPENDIHRENGEPAVFWEDFTRAVMSSSEFKGALEGGVQGKINDLFGTSQEWNLKITGACPDELKPRFSGREEVFFTAKIYREYPVVKP